MLPTVSIIIPHISLGDENRERGLQKCLDSIRCLNYPQELIETIVIEDEPRLGVPKRLKQGVEESSGEYIVYASNDCEFEPDSLITAINESRDTGKRLVAFDTGVRNEEGYICEHFLIKRDLIPLIGGEIFDTDISHWGCDDLLWKKCDKLGEAMISKGKVIHKHFSRIGSGVEKDVVNELALVSIESDRKLVRQKLDHIPKRIFSIWLSDKKELPELIEKCINSQKEFCVRNGYEFRQITLDNCFKNKYIEDAINSKQWGKACDYLRIHYLIEEGGIYLDADVEMLPDKTFDNLLDREIFAARENNMFINTAVLGAKKGNNLLQEHLKEVELRFRGDDGLYFESSIEIFTPRYYESRNKPLEPEYFYPYDHQRNTVDIKDHTICYHHFYRSWIKK